MTNTGLKFAFLGFAVLSLIGAFLPVASAESLFVNAGHLNGIAYLLYLLPLGAISLSILNIYRKNISYMRVWFISLGIAGILLGLVVANAGINHLNGFIAMQVDFQQRSERFEESFNKSWNESMRNFGETSGESSPKVKASEQPRQDRQPKTTSYSVPKAGIGTGAILFIIGNLGIVIMNLKRWEQGTPVASQESH